MKKTMQPKIGIIGATGNVGREVVSQLLAHHMMPERLVLAGSSYSRGTSLIVDGHGFPIQDVNELPLCALYILATEDAISRFYAPRFLAQGAFVLDASAAFRSDPQVPLLCGTLTRPLINLNQRLYAHSNCIASPLAMVLSPLLKQGTIRSVYLSTYQSVSGAGAQALKTLLEATEAFLQDTSPLMDSPFPRPVAFNLFPEIGAQKEQGWTSEEQKINFEVQKILGCALDLYVTAVRVPTLYGHAMTAWIEFEEACDLPAINAALEQTEGIILSNKGGYSTPQQMRGSDQVSVGRLYVRPPRHLHLWLCTDNLRRGASTDLVESALHILTLLSSVHSERRVGMPWVVEC